MKFLVLVIPAITIVLALVLEILYLDKYEREHTPNDGHNI